MSKENPQLGETITVNVPAAQHPLDSRGQRVAYAAAKTQPDAIGWDHRRPLSLRKLDCDLQT